MKILKIVGASILALSLVLGITFPVLAAPPDEVENKVPPKIMRGKVVSIDKENQGFFVIQADEQEPATILVDSDTKYFKALIPRKVIALAPQEQMILRQPKVQQRVRAVEPTHQ